MDAGTNATGWPAAVRAAAEEALGLVFPTWCAGCDEPDVALCGACRLELRPVVRRRVLSDGLVVHSALDFSGVPARVIRALKEDGRTGLARPLGETLRDTLTVALRETTEGAPGDVRTVLAVPIPSSRAAMRRRGYAVAELLARRAGVRPVRLLAPAARAVDQRGLSVAERAANVAGTLRAIRRREGLRALLIDDVVTTGATLQEAARVLRDAGVDVVGAVTLASTSRKGFDPGIGR